MRTRTDNSFMPGIERVQNGTESKTCPSDSSYMDLINECQKLGDYVVNVVEARMGTRQTATTRSFH